MTNLRRFADRAESLVTGELVKAEIVNLSNEAKKVTCMFNPKIYTLSKSNKWTPETTAGRNAPEMTFGGGEPAKLSLELFFDTYEKHYEKPGGKAYEAGEDVRKYTSVLWEMMLIDKKLGHPPACQFKWGAILSFKAVITSIEQKFTLFLPNGTPVRARLTVQFQQYEDETWYPKQNPTSGGRAQDRMHTVCEGETLASIAFLEYGDATVWRHIAETNKIMDPRRLRAGHVLLITALPGT